MKYVFDLDGTLCSEEGGHYREAQPFKQRIAAVNELYDAGAIIVISTARGADLHRLTRLQLIRWGVKYSGLVCGSKPYADFYIDDKALSAHDFFHPVD